MADTKWRVPVSIARLFFSIIAPRGLNLDSTNHVQATTETAAKTLGLLTSGYSCISERASIDNVASMAIFKRKNPALNPRTV